MHICISYNTKEKISQFPLKDTWAPLLTLSAPPFILASAVTVLCRLPPRAWTTWCRCDRTTLAWTCPQPTGFCHLRGGIFLQVQPRSVGKGMPWGLTHDQEGMKPFPPPRLMVLRLFHRAPQKAH